MALIGFGCKFCKTVMRKNYFGKFDCPECNPQNFIKSKDSEDIVKKCFEAPEGDMFDDYLEDDSQ